MAMAPTSPIRARCSSRSPSCAATLPLLHLRAARRGGRAAYLSPDAVLAIARAGQRGRLQRSPVHPRRQAGTALRRGARGTRRARLRRPRWTIWPTSRALVLQETGLLPHLNPGVMTALTICDACARCRCRKASCWRRYRSGCRKKAARISARPTRTPAVRLATIPRRASGACRSHPGS